MDSTSLRIEPGLPATESIGHPNAAGQADSSDDL
jgi:hypothetical protein